MHSGKAQLVRAVDWTSQYAGLSLAAPLTRPLGHGGCEFVTGPRLNTCLSPSPTELTSFPGRSLDKESLETYKKKEKLVVNWNYIMCSIP